MNRRKMLQKEIEHLKKHPLVFCQVDPVNEKQDEWKVTLMGPEDSPYEGGIFELQFKFKNYPCKPPSVTMQTKIFHININEKGKICIDLLIDQWNKKQKNRDVLEKLYDLLKEPSFDDAINDLAAAHYYEDQDKYFIIAKEWTVEYATNGLNGLNGLDGTQEDRKDGSEDTTNGTSQSLSEPTQSASIQSCDSFTSSSATSVASSATSSATSSNNSTLRSRNMADHAQMASAASETSTSYR